MSSRTPTKIDKICRIQFIIPPLRWRFLVTSSAHRRHTHVRTLRLRKVDVTVSLHVLGAVMDFFSKVVTSLVPALHLQNISLKNASEDPHTDVVCPSSCCKKQSLHCTCRLASASPSQSLTASISIYSSGIILTHVGIVCWDFSLGLLRLSSLISVSLVGLC